MADKRPIRRGYWKEAIRMVAVGEVDTYVHYEGEGKILNARRGATAAIVAAGLKGKLETRVAGGVLTIRRVQG